MDPIGIQIKEFESQKSLFKDLAEDVEALINNFLLDRKINFLEVISRVKESDSLKD